MRVNLKPQNTNSITKVVSAMKTIFEATYLYPRGRAVGTVLALKSGDPGSIPGAGNAD